MSAAAYAWAAFAMLYVVGIDLAGRYIREVDSRDGWLPATRLELRVWSLLWPVAVILSRVQYQWRQLRKAGR